MGRNRSVSGMCRVMVSGLVLAGAAVSLAGCEAYDEAARERCSKTKPDMSLLREGDMTAFLTPCGLQGVADATGRVRLHYQPPRRDGTLPVSANANFTVSEEGGSRGRIWYLCMPVPALPVSAPPAPALPSSGSLSSGTSSSVPVASAQPVTPSRSPVAAGSAAKPAVAAVPSFISPGSQQAVCRYAGSGVDRMSLTYDRDDAASHDPRNW